MTLYPPRKIRVTFVLPSFAGGGAERVGEIHSCPCTHARPALARNAPALSWFLFHGGARLVRATQEMGGEHQIRVYKFAPVSG